MVKINRKTRKIKRTKKFNRKVSSKVFKNNIKRIIEKKTRKLKGGLKQKTAGALEYEFDINFLKGVIDIDKLQTIKTDKDVNIKYILLEDSVDKIVIDKIKELFIKYGIKTIHDLKNNVFKIKEKFIFFKKKKQNEQKGNILFISEEDRNKQEAKLWLTDYFYTQKSSGKTSRIEKLEGIINFNKQNFVIFDNRAIEYKPNQKPSDLILRYFDILKINNMTDFNVQIPKPNPNIKSSKAPINNFTESNEISHIWYKYWPDGGVPENIFEFRLFCEKLKQDIINNGKDVTTLIHCSAGIGRTGTLYIILYIMFELDINNCKDFNHKLNDKSVDERVKYITDTIIESRNQRMNMVQTYKQLEFIIDIFDINIPKTINIETIFNNLNVKSNSNNFLTTRIGKQCLTLNRYENILPFDDSRVKLLPVSKSGDLETGLENCENYVNASYMNSFANSFKVIASDCPNNISILHFKRMLKQEQVTIIVMLTGLIEKNKSKCNDYTTGNVLTNISKLDIDKKIATMNVDSICKTSLKLQKSIDNKDLELVEQKNTENYFTRDEQQILKEQ